jgi:hypothetical protein
MLHHLWDGLSVNAFLDEDPISICENLVIIIGVVPVTANGISSQSVSDLPERFVQILLSHINTEPERS